MPENRDNKMFFFPKNNIFGTFTKLKFDYFTVLVLVICMKYEECTIISIVLTKKTFKHKFSNKLTY